MLSDIEIAQKNEMTNITDIAAKLGLSQDDIELYGNYKAKISMKSLRKFQEKVKDPSQRGKLILVTAITPTPAGEGKSTVSIGLADGLRKIGKKSVVALREPSLGPCFGIKGGACGGGYAQIVPMEDINLHFTGDLHAISIANNLIAALIDNHLQQGNALNIDPRTISWKRCVDLNDRALRNITIGLGGKMQGVPREDHFTIAVASEIMAIICLSQSITELKDRISKIVIGQNFNKEDVTFGQLKSTGAVAALLKDAIRPNLVQTLEKTPAFVHGGPFANIAHGCNSVNATLCALATGDYVITEAGFAADLGAEKFMDIKCRNAGIAPDAVVIVATIRALKMHGGVPKTELSEENLFALEKGFENLATHIENIKKFGVPAIVAVNKFVTDTDAEIKKLEQLCSQYGAKAVLSEGWEFGGEGTKTLSQAVVETCEVPSNFHFMYEDHMSFKEKVETIAKEIYRAGSVEFQGTSLKKLKEFEEKGYGNLPICIAKTQSSISHDPKAIGAPKDFIFPVRDVQLYAGAGFVVILAGDIMTMPGLPKVPAAEYIDVDDDGVISGLF
ncbi:MAG: formate--tetrahydrofolate ligase [Treponema sp.]|uniref:formate--tetrahydrofolate ligase n=1 Tax=Treponema sp. TaxID=166 RepID=UPI00298E2B23|nr:formate--tetrahydrofolate ligase [Treponema sp.]MCI5696932.1 formate--tetrahydrofolate ligase [Spirochaetia bacterium]MDD5811566.1 formate--tetrahydrofolate ligase [Treponema sp.]MDY5885550.1 formate--tetrahydrofolate ligase [Treponema sp.]